MRRRDFIKYLGGGAAALIVGTALPSWISQRIKFSRIGTNCSIPQLYHY